MLWLMFDGWLRFETPRAYGFSFDKSSKIIDMLVSKSQIGLVTYSEGDALESVMLKEYPVKVEAIQMEEWIAIKLAKEHGLECEV